MSKHTPGPWKYRHSESKNAFNVVGTRLGGNYKIARCPYPVYDFEAAEKRNKEEKDEAEANAKLCAAAPELLEALKNLVLWQYGTINHYHALEDAAETIKKATI